MDPWHFGSNLISLDGLEGCRRRLSRTAAEDAYYEEHMPADSHVPRIAFMVVAVWLGFFAVGVWLR